HFRKKASSYRMRHSTGWVADRTHTPMWDYFMAKPGGRTHPSARLCGSLRPSRPPRSATASSSMITSVLLGNLIGKFMSSLPVLHLHTYYSVRFAASRHGHTRSRESSPDHTCSD